MQKLQFLVAQDVFHNHGSAVEDHLFDAASLRGSFGAYVCSYRWSWSGFLEGLDNRNKSKKVIADVLFSSFVIFLNMIVHWPAALIHIALGFRMHLIKSECMRDDTTTSFDVQDHC